MLIAARPGIAVVMLSLSIAAAGQQSPSACKLDPTPHAARGETIAVKMHLVNDGASCGLSPRVGASKADSISVVEAPQNGQVVIDGPAVRYTPTSGFSGTDHFLVACLAAARVAATPGPTSAPG